MKKGDRYARLVEWSDEDSCFIGSCPELFYGGCHGLDARVVFSELCDMIDSSIDLYEREGRALPEPMSGREFVNALQRIA
jgi:predicted RNase H-like HicB family nuclease